MLRIGLTGGIASGKSTVAKLLKQLGLPVIDADQIAKEIMQPQGPALQEIESTFGKEYILKDGQLHREKLAHLIFKDPKHRHTLNQITHPKIASEAALKMDAYRQQGCKALVYEVPLLFEAGLHQTLKPVILVAASVENQIKRLYQRDQFSEKEALLRIQSQMSLEEKRLLSDYIIENVGTLDALSHATKEIWKNIQKSHLN